MTWTSGKGRGGKYGAPHQRARRQWAAKHQPWHPCARCGKPLGPMSPQLHLDHAENGAYLGFSHSRCNIRAGSQKGARIRNGTPTRSKARQGATTRLTW